MTVSTKWNECQNCGHFESNHLIIDINKTICVTHENTVGNCKCVGFVK